MRTNYKILNRLLLCMMALLLGHTAFCQKIEYIESNAPFSTVYLSNLDSIWKLKLKSGDYIVYYDSKKTKLKSSFRIINKRIDGRYTEWFNDGRICKEIEFKNGLYHGTHRESMIFSENGKEYYLTNISIWINGAQDKIVQMEW